MLPKVSEFRGKRNQNWTINVNAVVSDRTSTVNLNAQNDISIASINAPGGKLISQLRV
jgi:hypothetical protein